mgnify:CR=1 FL=1
MHAEDDYYMLHYRYLYQADLLLLISAKLGRAIFRMRTKLKGCSLKIVTQLVNVLIMVTVQRKGWEDGGGGGLSLLGHIP